MIFRERKIPKHLIIQEEYELRARPRTGVFKFIVLLLLVAGMAYAISAGIIAI